MNLSPQNLPLEQVLQQLHDIQPPDAPGLWPPAPGWYLVAALLALALVWLGNKGLRWIRVRLWLWRSVRRLPKPADNPAYFAALNRAMKAAVAQRFPDTNPWPLSGAQWIEFLHRNAPRMDDRLLEAFVLSGLRPTPELPPRQADSIARDWLRRQCR